MSVIRVGSTNTYSHGWDAIFSGAGSGKRATKKKVAKKAPQAKATKKAVRKKAKRR
jgi:hypothetical protein